MERIPRFRLRTLLLRWHNVSLILGVSRVLNYQPRSQGFFLFLGNEVAELPIYNNKVTKRINWVTFLHYKGNFNFINDVENLNFIAGGTATRLALNRTIEKIVPETRKRSKKALFLITDGRSNIGGDPTSDAMILRDSCDFEIYTIGVTDSVDERELRSIASEPFRTHVFLLKNFEDLTKLKELITAKGIGEFSIQRSYFDVCLSCGAFDVSLAFMDAYRVSLLCY